MADEPDASFGTLDLDEGMIELIKPELVPGESLLWAVRSRTTIANPESRGALALLFWASCMILVSAGGFLVGRWFDGRLKSIEVMVVGLSVLLAFLAAIVVVHSAATWISRSGERRRLTKRIYALTDRRTIVWSPGKSPPEVEISSVPFSAIKVAWISRVQSSDGSGDLIFRHYGNPDRFQGISDVQKVEKLLRDHLPPSAWKSRSRI